MFKDRKLKFAIRKKKGGGGAASFIIGAVLLGSSMVFVPGFVSANSPSSSDSVVRTVRSVSEDIDISLNMDYYKSGVILTRSDQTVIPENYVIVPEGYHVDSMIYTNAGVITPDTIKNEKVTGQYKIRYTLKDSLNNDVYKDGQLVIRNSVIYFYDPTPVFDEIERVNEKATNGDYDNKEEVIEKLNTIKDKVENPSTIPNIPGLVNEVKDVEGTLTKTPDADKYEPTGEKITVPEGTPITEDDVKGKVTIPEGSGGTITNVGDIPETTTPGEKPAVEVTVTYPDGTTDTVEVPVEVTKTPDADKYEPTGEKITVPSSGISNGKHVKLPSTGEEQNILSMLGSLILMGVLGAFGLNKKKYDK